MTTRVHLSARAVLVGLSASLAAVAACTATALAFDRVETLAPIAAGRAYLYFVKELDVDQQPIAGRTVTMAVQQGAGPDASVAPSDSKGHATGTAGATATEVSGDDGLAYFLLRTSSTPGRNEFTWKDPDYSGEVVVVGKSLSGAGASPSASGGGTHAGGKGGGIGAHTRAAHLPPVAMPPLAAALLAFLLVLLLAPPVVSRYVRKLELTPGLAETPAYAETFARY